MACTRSSLRKRIRTLPVLIALLFLAGACSGDNGSPDSTVAAPTTTAPPSTTSTTQPPTTTTAPPTTTTTPPTTTTVPSDEEPELTARITDPEDLDQVAEVVEEFWAWYHWWLAHPEEDFDAVVAGEGTEAHRIIVEMQAELLADGQYMRDGLTIVEIWDLVLLPNDLIGVGVTVRRDQPRERIDAATGAVVEVEREATGETGHQSWVLYPQPDGSHRVGVWGPAAFQDI